MQPVTPTHSYMLCPNKFVLYGILADCLFTNLVIRDLLLHALVRWFYDIIKGHPGLSTYQPIIHSLHVLLE